jgi:hypothetical protein
MFELVVEVPDLALIFFSLRDVTERDYRATRHAVLAFQGTGAGLDPNPLGKSGIAQKHLGGAHLSVKGAY